MRQTIQKQRTFFDKQHTKNIQFRKCTLKKLHQAIRKNEKNIIEALRYDLSRPQFETFIAEIYLVLQEINYMLKHLDCMARTKQVSTPFPFFPSKSYIRQEAYGVVLIMAPWNYPFQLCMTPLVGAIAAGNCVIIKPSEYAPYTAQCIQNIISAVCQPEHVSVIQGDEHISQELLQEQFDYIFFTGSPRVGKIVMHAAAEHLTPLTLELGGKNPCIVDDTTHISSSIRRIAWGKFLNAGQNCTSPDYLLVHESIKDACIAALQKSLRDMYGNNAALSNDYGRIINAKHMQRLKNLLEAAPIITGGDIDEKNRYIAPTLVDTIDIDHPLLQEEIFGPILPIITYTNPEYVITFIKRHPRPLACYIFTENHKQQCYYMNNIQAGGICINDVVLQSASVYLPFGGVGASGFGAYHGAYSFSTFSRPQSVIKTPTTIDFSLRYPPFTKKHQFLQRVLRWLVS